MKRYLLLFFLFSFLHTHAQKVKITSMSRDYFRHTNVEGFSYLHEDLTEDAYQWIATARIEFDTIRPETLKRIYNKANAKGNKIGANAFRVLDSDVYAFGQNKFIELDIFHLRQENRKENLRLFQGRKVYLFGFLGHHRKIGGYKISVNGEKMLLQELRYKFFEPMAGRELKICLGKGFKKDEIRLIVEKQMLPRYYKFDVYRGVFSRGQISEHEWSFGEFLARILKKETETL